MNTSPRHGLALLLAAILAARGTAQISSSGDVSPAGLTSPVWNVTDDLLRVGNAAPGGLTVAGGGTLTSNNAMLGGSTTAPGTVAVAGSGSTWTNGNILEVLDGSLLTVQDFADLTTTDLTVAAQGGISRVDILTGGAITTNSLGLANGRVMVSGAGSALTIRTSGVLGGYLGTTELRVDSGGDVNVEGYEIRVGVAGSGLVSITGAGSTLTAPLASLEVVGGDGGDADVHVAQGGYLEAGLTVVGSDTGTGEILVAGAGSYFRTGTTHVGYFAQGSVTVAEGGHMELGGGADGLFIGYGDDVFSSVDSGTVVVTGAGSRLDANVAFVGAASGRGTLVLSEGGTATIYGGFLGLATDSMDGDGQQATLKIGEGGLAGTLEATEVRGAVGASAVIFNHTDTVVFDPRLTSGLTVSKLGSGTTSLVGENTYSGGTTVSAGRLLANNTAGSALGTGPVTVHSGATLGGGDSSAA